MGQLHSNEREAVVGLVTILNKDIQTAKPQKGARKT